MDSVVVNRDELLETVQKNAAKHRDLFEAAQKGYRREVIKALDEMLQDEVLLAAYLG